MGYYQKQRPARTEAFHPPVELRENTKARRAWCAEKLAELQAAGRDARITGIGSYQHVSAKVVKPVLGTRDQRRGLCQICERDIAIEDGGALAAHGYRRPFVGVQTSSCPGAGHLPLSSSCRRTRLEAAWAEEEMARLTKKIEDAPNAERLPFTRDRRSPTIEVTPATAADLIDKRIVLLHTGKTAWEVVVAAYQTARRMERTSYEAYLKGLRTIDENFEAGKYQNTDRVVKVAVK